MYLLLERRGIIYYKHKAEAFAIPQTLQPFLFDHKFEFIGEYRTNKKRSAKPSPVEKGDRLRSKWWMRRTDHSKNKHSIHLARIGHYELFI